jgi:tetraacyldisaccharide 4'-kinase
LRGTRVLAFAGIGDPEKFFATLSAAGIEAALRRGFGDHHRYSVVEARALLRDAEASGLQLLTTEKDFARLQDDMAVADLTRRVRALPVMMKVAPSDEFARLVLGPTPA